MSTVKVTCTDQVLTFENTPVIASGGVNEDTVQFSFCSRWDGFTLTAVFWRSEAEAYHVLLDEENSCIIPHEVLTDAGVIWFGVFGVNADGVQRTTEALSYTVYKGAITENTQPSDPTPDIYTQILAEVQSVRELSAETLAAEQAFEEAMNQTHAAFETAMEEKQAAFEEEVEADQEEFKEEVRTTIRDRNAHADTHATDGDDPITPASIGAATETAVATAQSTANTAKTNAATAQSTANARAQITTGSYTGTGTYGANNPCSLTFDFVPKFLIVYTSNATQTTGGSTSLTWVGQLGAASGGDNNVSVSGSAISWYGGGAGQQLNANGTKYFYIAIG